MANSPLFKSAEGYTKMVAWYQRFLDALPYAHSSELVDTPSGQTHVLRLGPKDGPPLVVLHGALSGAPHILGQLGRLPELYNIYALDILGQSVKSEQKRLPTKNGAHGRWLWECLDALGLESTSILGVSWGGFVALDGAILAPERVKSLSLMVPAALVPLPVLRPAIEVAWPMLLYRLFPSKKRRDRAFAGLFSHPDPMWLDFIDDAMRFAKIDFQAPPRFTDDQLAALTMPVQLIAAEADLSFPGPALLKRAQGAFPNLKSQILLEDCRHCPPTLPGFGHLLMSHAHAFFQDEGDGQANAEILRLNIQSMVGQLAAPAA